MPKHITSGSSAYVTVGSSDSDFITDGTSDNVEMTSALADGRTVIIKPGTYNLSASVNVPSNRKVILERGAIVVWDSKSFSAFVGTGVTNVEIDGGYFSAGEVVTGTIPNEYHAIYFKDASHNIKVQNVYGTGIASGTVRFRNGCYDFIVDSVIAENTDAALIVSVNCRNFVARNITARNTFAEGIYCEDIRDFLFENIYVENCTRDGLLITDFNTGVRSNRGKISNVTAYDNTVAGVSITGIDNAELSNITSYANTRDGILLDNCNYVKLNNTTTYNNNQARSVDGTSTFAGLRANNSTHIDVDSLSSYDSQGVPTQYQGITTSGTCDYIVIRGGGSENNVATTQTTLLGNNSRAFDHRGIMPRIIKNHGNVGAAPAIQFKDGDMHVMTITQNATLSSFGTGVPEGSIVSLWMIEDGTGGWTITMPANFVKNPSTSAFNTGSNQTNIVQMQKRGSFWYELTRFSTA